MSDLGGIWWNYVYQFSVNSEGDHTSDRLSDLHDPKSPTWWQSETIYEGIQYPTAVNLTLNLGIYKESYNAFIWLTIPKLLQENPLISRTSALCFIHQDLSLLQSTRESHKTGRGLLINTTVPLVEAPTACQIPFLSKRVKMNHERCVPANTVTFLLCNSVILRSHRWRDAQVHIILNTALSSSNGLLLQTSEYPLTA